MLPVARRNPFLQQQEICNTCDGCSVSVKIKREVELVVPIVVSSQELTELYIKVAPLAVTTDNVPSAFPLQIPIVSCLKLICNTRLK